MFGRFVVFLVFLFLVLLIALRFFCVYVCLFVWVFVFGCGICLCDWGLGSFVLIFRFWCGWGLVGLFYFWFGLVWGVFFLGGCFVVLFWLLIVFFWICVLVCFWWFWGCVGCFYMCFCTEVAFVCVVWYLVVL